MLKGQSGDPLAAALAESIQGQDLIVRGECGDPRQEELPHPDASVDPALLRELLTGQRSEQPRRLTLERVWIDGDLDLESTQLLFPLVLFECRVRGDVELVDSDTRRLYFEDCRLRAFRAEGIRTRGELSLRESHLTHVDLECGRVSDHLNLNGCRIEPAGGEAVLANFLQVEASMLGNELIAHGADGFHTLCFGGAKIGGQLSLNAAKLTATGDACALFADGTVVNFDLACREGFSARSDGRSATVRLLGAQVGGQLTFSGSCENSGGPAFDAEGASAEDIILRDFDIRGAGPGASAANLTSVAVKARLGFFNVLLDDEDSGGGRLAPTLTLRDASARALSLMPRSSPTYVSLADGHFGLILDHESTWPLELDLRGCAYDELKFEPGPAGDDVEARLQWLRRGSTYDPQPYSQLASHYRARGNDTAARKVAIASRRRRAESLSPLPRLGEAILRFTVGYGYRPALAVLWLAGLATLGAIVFGALPTSDFTPTRDPSFVPDMNPLVYSLDLLVPVVDFGQRSAWTAVDAAQWISIAFIAAGWTLTTALVVGVTSALRGD